MSQIPTFESTIFDADLQDSADDRIPTRRQKEEREDDDEVVGKGKEDFAKQMADEPDDDEIDSGENDTSDDADGDDEIPSHGAAGRRPDILARGFNVGLSMEDMNGYRSAADLEKAIAFIEKRGAAGGPPKPEPKAEPDPDEYVPLKLKLGDEFGDQEKGAFEQIVKHVNESLAKLHGNTKAIRGELGGARSAAQRAEALHTQQLLDSWFGGREYQGYFGEKPMDQLEDDSSEQKRRVDVLNEMRRVKAGYQATGEPAPPIRKIFERSVRAIYGDKFAKPAPGKGQVLPKKADGRNVSQPRPTAKSYQPRSGREAAIAGVKKFMKERGIKLN